MKEKINKETGEITTLSKEDFNKVIYKETRRQDGSLRIQQDFTNCPTMTEQHTAHLTDINYLIKTYKPDEIAMYLATRAAHRKEILGHDFAQEPNLQEAKKCRLCSKTNVRESRRGHSTKIQNSNGVREIYRQP